MSEQVLENFKNEVRNTPGGANVLNCFLCGSCTAGCPVNEIDDSYNPRKIMRMILLDKQEEILKSDEIWKCNQCHACVSHCPQDVRFADVLRTLRELAVEKGYKSQELIDKINALDIEAKKDRLAKICQALNK